jgi:hypothetical protein
MAPAFGAAAIAGEVSAWTDIADIKFSGGDSGGLPLDYFTIGTDGVGLALSRVPEEAHESVEVGKRFYGFIGSTAPGFYNWATH